MQAFGIELKIYRYLIYLLLFLSQYAQQHMPILSLMLSEVLIDIKINAI